MHLKSEVLYILCVFVMFFWSFSSSNEKNSILSHPVSKNS